MKAKLVFDLDILENNIVRFLSTAQSVFKNKTIRVFYAIKANNQKEIIECMEKRGIGAEILSKSELDLVSDSIPLQVNGHYKSNELLEASLIREDCTINIEDISELKRIKKLFDKNGWTQKVRIGIRLKNKEDSRIGIQAKQIAEIIEYAKVNQWMELHSLHFHMGWNNKNMSEIENVVGKMNDINYLLLDYGVAVPAWNFGGSFAEHSSNPKQLSERMRFLQKEIPQNVNSIYFEPGRYFVGDAGYMEAHILEKRGEQYIIDTSTYGYKLSGATPNILMYDKLNRKMEKMKISKNVKNSICISGIWPSENDFLLIEKSENEVCEGNKIIFHNLGGYLDGSFSTLTHEGLLAYDFIGKLNVLFDEISLRERKLFLKYWNFTQKSLQLPKSNKDLLDILHILKTLFQMNKVYKEEIINSRLKEYHLDFCRLRRELVNEGIFKRLDGELLYERKK